MEPDTPMWSLAALSWAAAFACGAPFVACWTGRWPSVATGHTGQVWNTLLPGMAVGFALIGLSFLTGWAWPVLGGLVAVAAGLLLLVARAFSDRTLLEPTWLREQRRAHRTPTRGRGVRW